ncbi:hypothetical protein [Desulfogranum marinum]|uniref:hypothetical protein n=1 Tax=Desulfogranum marinum TaxID=453220 RepID=UPI0019663E05|nr:hypothetical protein [Desulfogranum marinum]MBM9512809.1 hypothetical protein [Desulfogranum marinum]
MAILYLPVSLLRGSKRRKCKEKGGRKDKKLQRQKEGRKANKEEKRQQKESRNIIPVDIQIGGFCLLGNDKPTMHRNDRSLTSIDYMLVLFTLRLSKRN